jgi:hypothetical protein
MYAYLMREVAGQRIAELQEEARRSNLARALRKTMRQRNRADARSTFVPPAIPDYVDGTFREAGVEVPAEHAGAGC